MHPDYAPSLFVFTNTSTERHAAKLARYTRLSERERKTKNRDELLKQRILEEEEVKETAEILLDLSQPSLKVKSQSTLTDPDPLLCQNLQLKRENRQLLKEIQLLQEEKNQLKEKLSHTSTDVSHMATDAAKLKFFTGVPSYAVFLWILSLISAYLKPMKCVSKSNQLLLTLMKLRLNLTNRDLAYRFKVSGPTVSSIINFVIPVLAKRLSFLVKWPSKLEIRRNLPRVFRKKYSNCRVIIDCSEVFIERPYNLSARNQTWSNYKHHHTLKVLLGITPHGSVSFVSKCWGGRISDKELTSRSGFYDKITFGDMVMADRGFTISEELAVRGATLAIPPFTKGRRQLRASSVASARRLSSVRIHVERAFERIKNFKILSTLPITLMSHASDIFFICAALTNLLPKLVKR